MKNIILIYNEKTYQFDCIKDLKTFLLNGVEEKNLQKYMYEKCFGFCAVENLRILNTKVGVYGDNYSVNTDEKTNNIENAFIVDNIDTFILSLCRYNIITLLEEKNHREYTINQDIAISNGNYIIVNYFAEKILKDMVGE